MDPRDTKAFPASCTTPRTNADHPVALVLPEIGRTNSVMAFSVRTGGCSPPPFKSLNFAVSQGDAPENVRCNYKTLSKRLGIEAARIAACRQMHGDTVEIIDSLPHISARADAIITSTPGIYPSIKTADCVPILLLDPVRRVAGAIHAGWRGTVLRISRKVVRIMKSRFGSNPTDLVAGLGPSIGSCCYEVDEVVLKPYRQAFPEAEQFVIRSKSGALSKESLRLDLVGVNRFELIQGGVPPANIHSTELCTSCNSALFFSYRRDGVKSGRHVAIAGFIP
ncbi:MAG: peptidoglycan editing factor PgeF [Desulfomonilaceae bacterium]